MVDFDAVLTAFQDNLASDELLALIECYLFEIAPKDAETEAKSGADYAAVRSPTSLPDAEATCIALAAYFGRLDVLKALERTRCLSACDVTGLPCLTCLLRREYAKPTRNAYCITGASHGIKQTIILYGIAGGNVPVAAYLTEEFASRGYHSLDAALVDRFGQVTIHRDWFCGKKFMVMNFSHGWMHVVSKPRRNSAVKT